MEATELLKYAQRLQAIAQAGLAYATSPYDLERYQEIRAIGAHFLEALTDEKFEKIIRVFASETGYQTPKVDVRAVIFQGLDEILMVKETVDQGRWTLPGGWADVGYTPNEVVVKEALEETGLMVEAVRLLALLDKREHAHPPQPWYVYKVFIECKVIGGSLVQETSETSGVRWIHRHEIAALELSTDRVTLDQLTLMFQFAESPFMPALCD